MNKNIFIVASGTGGHVIPAKNISEILISHDYKITWIGTISGIENKLITDKEVQMKYIKSSGIRGKSFRKLMEGILNLIISFFQSLILIYKEKPLFILGFGGYITVSISIAAFIMGVPVYAHESNSIAGTSNKINNFFSRKTFQTFPRTFSESKKIILSGNPIRDSFNNITNPQVKYTLDRETLNVLVFGGSQGSKFFNQNIPKCLSQFSNKFKITHITGLENREGVKKIYNVNQMDANVLDFSFDMETLYDWSDIIISRSGSMTVSEICKAGRTPILVPFLYATDNHQYFNAKYLKDNDAAIIIEESDNFSEELEKNLTNLYSNQLLLSKLAINGKNLFPDDSSAIILGNIPELNEKFNNTTSKK